MGKYRFRLSDMMPNAWFYKLRDMSNRASRNPTLPHLMKKAHPTRAGGCSTPKPLPPPHPPAEQPFQPRRASYYFSSRQGNKALSGSPVHPRASDTLFPVDPPRKSKKKARSKPAKPSNKLVSSVAAGWTCRAIPEFPAAPESPTYQKEADHVDDSGRGGDLPCFDKLIIAEHYDNCDSVDAWPRPCSCRVTPTANDAAMDVGSTGNSSSTGKPDEQERLHAAVPEFGLSPILTRPAKKEAKPSRLADAGTAKSKARNRHTPVKDPKKSSLRRSPPGTQRLRLRSSSPRLASRVKLHRTRKTTSSTPRKCLSESFAVVKASSDPQRDFRDSMMEMIVENNIRASGDLEDLLACYLSLNSNEYHDVIVKVFEQIWFDLTDGRRQGVPRLSRCR